MGIDHTKLQKGSGSQILDLIKGELLTEERSACRYIIVDAINSPAVLNFYSKNGFELLFPDEQKEFEYYSELAPLKTRFMFFDLLPLYKMMYQ